MKFKSFLAKPFAAYVNKSIRKSAANAINSQEDVFKDLLKTGSKTAFGQEHGMSDIKNYDDFKKQIPIRDYEQFKKYIELIKEGKHNVLWKGQPIYFGGIL